MYLTQAIDELREKLIQYRLSGRKPFWASILKQLAKQDSLDGNHAETILEAIRAFLKPLDDKTIISLWRQTDTGMSDDSDDGSLFPDSCRMDPEMELLQELANLALEEAKASRG